MDCDNSLTECSKEDLSIFDIVPTQFYSLGDNVFVCIHEWGQQLEISIRKMNVIQNRKMFTKQAVVMNLETWYHFCEKIQLFNFVSVNSSFIINNCVWILNFRTHALLQNFHSSPEPRLNETYVTLTPDQMDQFYELEKDINLYLIDVLWVKLLPQELSLAWGNYEDNSEKILDQYITCLEKHMLTQIHKFYHCEGCIVDSLSQLNHDCIYVPIKKKFESLGWRAMLLLNTKNAMKGMCAVEPNIFKILKNMSVVNYENVLFAEDKDKRILFDLYLNKARK